MPRAFQPYPNTSEEELRKTKKCKFFAVGRCQRGAACSFAHRDDELREVCLYKTRACASFGRSGSCKSGNNCRFAHGQEELRSVAVRSSSFVSASAAAPAPPPTKLAAASAFARCAMPPRGYALAPAPAAPVAPAAPAPAAVANEKGNAKGAQHVAAGAEEVLADAVDSETSRQPMQQLHASIEDELRSRFPGQQLLVVLMPMSSTSPTATPSQPASMQAIQLPAQGTSAATSAAGSSTVSATAAAYAKLAKDWVQTEAPRIAHAARMHLEASPSFDRYLLSSAVRQHPNTTLDVLQGTSITAQSLHLAEDEPCSMQPLQDREEQPQQTQRQQQHWSDSSSPVSSDFSSEMDDSFTALKQHDSFMKNQQEVQPGLPNSGQSSDSVTMSCEGEWKLSETGGILMSVKNTFIEFLTEPRSDKVYNKSKSAPALMMHNPPRGD
eukprot:TRINITY_DN6080_c1_g2_i1.p1 TRINITY_DN6080_c1_g2~~TRINITY_DN6080_c1_g2_i1.p1  ORF type:complete len:455 (-),score=95.46 TRINITY_DN6080_c1_g2_i1:188-1507(-)